MQTVADCPRECRVGTQRGRVMCGRGGPLLHRLRAHRVPLAALAPAAHARASVLHRQAPATQPASDARADQRHARGKYNHPVQFEVREMQALNSLHF